MSTGGTTDGVVVTTKTITVDGDSTDWASIDAITTDNQNDHEVDERCVGSADIKSIYLAKDSSYVYWRMDLWDSVNEISTLSQLNLVFYGKDGLGIFPAINQSNGWISKKENGEWRTVSDDDNNSSLGVIVEGRVPNSIFGNLSNIKRYLLMTTLKKMKAVNVTLQVQHK